MRVTKPLVYEREEGISPQIVFPHEALSGIAGPLPPITGFVLTELKDNPLVEVGLRSPYPGDEQTSTILASWNYGLGRVLVLTTDVGNRWASSWTQWENYDALVEQIVRWSMRPRDQEGGFLVTTEFEEGKIRAVVTALDEDREFIDFLDMTCSVTTPDLQTREMTMRQVSPGRYVGELSADDPGSYFMTIHAGQGRGTIRAGINVPYAAEFKDKATNWPLLETLASQTPVGGERGVLIQSELLSREVGDLVHFDTFRPTLAAAISLNDVWPLLLVLAACVFFFDVLIRRVMFNPVAVFSPVIAWLRQHPASPPPEHRMDRLRERKAAVARQIEQHRVAGRFEHSASHNPAATEEVRETDSGVSSHEPTPPAIALPEQDEDLSYTSRLLAAKHRAQSRQAQALDQNRDAS